jgi:hypothetical protein
VDPLHLLRVMFTIALVMLISGPLISASEGEPSQPTEPRVLATVVAAPLTPSLSTIAFDLPFSVLSSARPWSRTGASFWVLSDSPYLIPRSYVELGFVVDWAFIETFRHRLAAGLGTAVGIETLQESVSIPLIIKMSYCYALLKWLSIESAAEVLIYNQGGGIVLDLQALSRPFSSGILFGVGIGYGFLSEWDFNPHGDAFRIDLTVGYSWPRTRRTMQ